MVRLNVMPNYVSEQASGVLLVLAATEDAALRIERHLRNAGHPLRTAWIASVEELNDALRNSAPDVLLCEADLTSAPFAQVVERCRKLQPEIPLLQLNADVSATTIAAAIAAGAQDCVSLADTAHLRHLEHVVLREVISHDHLRALQRARERLAELESRQRYITEGTADAIARIQEGIVVEVNSAFAKLLGKQDASELAGQLLFDLIVPEQRSRIKQCLRTVLKNKHDGKPVAMTLDAGNGPARIHAKLMLGSLDGEASIEMLVSGGGGGGGASGAATSTSAYASHNDFTTAMRQSTDTDELRAALMAKLDGYAALEDRVGIIDAQAMCQLVGKDIRSHLDTGETLTQISSDELALLTHRADISAVEAFAETLRAGIGRQVFSTAQHEAHLTVSIAVYPLGQSDTADEALHQLATQVRKLSAAGGDRLAVLGTTGRDKMAERDAQRIVASVRSALKDGRMRLAYQAISEFDTTASTRFDVLLRMIDESHATLSAGEFLAQAQQAGLMPVIDRWVVTRVTELLTKHAGRQSLFTKLSEDTIAEPDAFLKWLERLLKQASIKRESLVFQIHQTVVQRHVRTSTQLCKALHNMGFPICVERFGAEATALKLLDYIPATYVKLHPDYMNNFQDRATKTRLQELLTACQGRRVQTIVSYVEDARTVAAVWQMGANFVQGFGVQEPDNLLTSQA